MRFVLGFIKGSFFSWNDCLAVGEITNQALNVLVLEDENKWSKSKIVVPLRFIPGNNNMRMSDNLSLYPHILICWCLREIRSILHMI